MTIDILVPPLSQTMDSLFLVKWNKNVGDPVTKGEALFVVETDKATLEVESPGTGILHEILAQAESDVKIKSRIGTILTLDEVQPPADPGPAPEPGRQATPAPLQAASFAALDAGVDDRHPYRIFASPRARRLAAQENLALAGIQATGPRRMVVERDVRAVLDQQKLYRPRLTPLAKRVADQAGVALESLAQANPGAKRITRADVETLLSGQGAAVPPEQTPATVHLAPAAPGGPGKDKRQRMSQIRRIIARRMQESHLTSAPVTLTRSVDATELKHLRDQILLELGPQDPRPSYTDFLISMTARCLQRHPALNGTFAEDLLDLSEEVHLNLAVDTDRGLVVPLIRSVQGRGLLELARLRIDLVRRALDNTLALYELEGGTFTLTNLGALGVDAFTPIINPPQIAILGVGRIHLVPAAFEGQIALREMMVLSLTFDHRIVDGGPAARLLQELAGLIEKPHRVWL